MNRQRVYIQATTQISIQSPLNEDWMQNPIQYERAFIRSIEPNFRDFISPVEARRIGRLQKRALTTSLTVIHQSKVEHPDAIITGTGLGCIENTELFLKDMCSQGEYLLKPTPFIQSTHNTISSLIAIYTQTHNYNVTYSHRNISFECALYDAMLQFRLQKINSALVGSHDELTPSWYELLKKVGYSGNPSAEASVSFMLTTERNNSWCELGGIKILHQPSIEILKLSLGKLLTDNGLNLSDIDAVITGINGNQATDLPTIQIYKQLFGQIPLLHYKHLFGDSYSASGLGLYSAACCLKYQFVPSTLYYMETEDQIDNPQNIMFFGQSDYKDYSLILLKSSCGK